MDKYKINKEKCIGCGACVATCPFGAIEMESDGKAVVDLDKCQGCGKCQKVCPVDAIDKISAE